MNEKEEKNTNKTSSGKPKKETEKIVVTQAFSKEEILEVQETSKQNPAKPVHTPVVTRAFSKDEIMEIQEASKKNKTAEPKLAHTRKHLPPTQ